jgi:hypothetical protein
MDLTVQGKGKISLAKTDFKAAGGEGTVFVKNGVAYKLYGQSDNSGKFIFNPKKMISLGKMQELSALTEPDIIKPENPLLDPKGTPVGYTMRALPDAIPLCQTFTKSFRDRSHLTPDHMLKLMQKLQAGVQHVHDKGLLIVDLNEMNFLVDSTFESVYFIDVDSYQTPHFPATAIMESIRDRHNSQFSVGTDWFSFAVVSFQMLVGIHPYKGKHDKLKTMDERMFANVSVLHSDVKLPGVCQPLSVVPSVYLDWYKAVLDRGERIAPPESLTAVIVVAPTVKRLSGSDHFEIETFGIYDGQIVAYVGNNVLTTTSVYAGSHRVGSAEAGSVLATTPIQNHPVVGRVQNGRLVLTDVMRKAELPLSVAADEIMATAGRIYLRQGDLLQEVSLTELPTKLLASVDVVGSILGQATQLFEGVAIQNLLGASYVGLLPASGKYYEVRVPELDEYRVIDAKFERGVLVLVGTKQGVYDRLVLRFDDNYSAYDLRRVEDVPLVGVNFTVLDSGVVALLNENEELELFSKARGNASVKVVPDPAISGECRLFSRGVQTLFAREDSLYKITMKKGS